MAVTDISGAERTFIPLQFSCMSNLIDICHRSLTTDGPIMAVSETGRMYGSNPVRNSYCCTSCDNGSDSSVTQRSTPACRDEAASHIGRSGSLISAITAAASGPEHGPICLFTFVPASASSGAARGPPGPRALTQAGDAGVSPSRRLV
jgi:hypothetical protein